MGQSIESEMARSSSPSSTVTRRRHRRSPRTPEDLFLERPARQVECPQGGVETHQVGRAFRKKLESGVWPAQGSHSGRKAADAPSGDD